MRWFGTRTHEKEDVEETGREAAAVQKE